MPSAPCRWLAALHCVNEPQLHVNARIHGALRDEMLALVSEGCQLVVATQSAGLMARARAIDAGDPGMEPTPSGTLTVATTRCLA